jgi:hypothetical protein
MRGFPRFPTNGPRLHLGLWGYLLYNLATVIGYVIAVYIWLNLALIYWVIKGAYLGALWVVRKVKARRAQRAGA